MPITPSWYDDDHTIIYLQYEGSWTWAESQAATEQMVEMTQGLDYSADIIVDMTHSPMLPSGITTQLGKIKANAQLDGLGLAVIVGVNRIMSAMIDIFTKLAPNLKKRMMVAKSIDEAERIIMDQRQQARR